MEKKFLKKAQLLLFLPKKNQESNINNSMRSQFNAFGIGWSHEPDINHR